MKQVTMLSLRNITISDKNAGAHTVRFTANVPRDVPAILVPAAMAAGCAPVDGENAEFAEDANKKIEFHGTLRETLLYLACKQVAEKNDSADFAGQIPRGDVLADIVGFKVSAKEATTAFQGFMAARHSGEEPKLHENGERILLVHAAKTKAELAELAELFELPASDWKSLAKSELHEYLLTKLKRG